MNDDKDKIIEEIKKFRNDNKYNSKSNNLLSQMVEYQEDKDKRDPKGKILQVGNPW